LTKNIEENPAAASILCKTKCRKNQKKEENTKFFRR
jgi:hypothetical protein